MAKPLIHAQTSAKKFGGIWQDYEPIHTKMDSSKMSHPKMSHRIIFHSSYGIQLIERLFGMNYPTSNESIKTADIAEQHIIEDLGFIPELTEYLDTLNTPWARIPYRNTTHLAKLSQRRWGGDWKDYLPIHEEMNSLADPRAKVIFYSAFGLFLIEELYGVALTLSDKRLISTREIAEQHILNTLHCIPTLFQWLEGTEKPWMAGSKKTKIVLVD